jgi:hypothetical protein
LHGRKSEGTLALHRSKKNTGHIPDVQMSLEWAPNAEVLAMGASVHRCGQFHWMFELINKKPNLERKVNSPKMPVGTQRHENVKLYLEQ